MKLTILVSRETEIIRTVDGVEMQVRAISIWWRNKVRSLHEETAFSGLSDVAIMVESRHGFKPLSRDPRVESGIICFLREYHGKQLMAFDCLAFVNMVYGVVPHTPRQLFNHRGIRKYSGRPRVGHVIFLVTPELHFFHHAAIYIGRGLYLSVYGAGGDLEVATLLQMKESYLASEVLVATPKAAP